MNKNRVKKAIEENRVAIGTHCFCEDIGFYEMCGLLGYDYVWIDNEHSGISNTTIRNGIVGANAGGCAAFVRIRNNEPALAKPVLEMGPDGIIFPMINTPEEAETAVKSCLYPPIGIRGFGPLRAMNYGVITDVSAQDYMEQANRDIMKIIQVEHWRGIENLDAILEVRGIDLVICGPMDLSASVGKPGRFDDPQVADMMNTIIAKCRAAKVRYGLSIGYCPELVEHWIDEGAGFISMGNPYDYFNLMSKQNISKFRDYAEKSKSCAY